MNAAATLCGEAGADAAVGTAIERRVHFLREQLGPRLVGVVATGSFSRGEGSVAFGWYVTGIFVGAAMNALTGRTLSPLRSALAGVHALRTNHAHSRFLAPAE